MAMRSLGSRLVVGSALWTVGLLIVAMAVAVATVYHFPRVAGRVHWTVLGFTAAILMVAGLTQLRRGMSPFHELRRRLQAVRDGAAMRVAGDYPPEVQPVVSDLNALLEQQAAAVDRAHAKAGDLAHGLKTPLAVLLQEAERAAAAGQGELADTIRQQVVRMQRQVSYHLAHARAAASGATLNARCSVSESAEGLARTLRRLYADRDLTIDVRVAPEHTARVQRADLDEMLGNLLDNACKWARGRVALSSEVAGGRLAITVDDDGGGIPEGMREAVLQRGVRADEAAPGSGLGLAIVGDLVELYEGSITLGTSPLGGLRARLELPAA